MSTLMLRVRMPTPRLILNVYDGLATTEWRDQLLGTRPRPGNLETFSNGRVRDRDFWIFKIGARPGRDRESPALSLENETKPGRDLNKISRYWDETSQSI